MIHELEGMHFDNAFHNLLPKSGDRMIIVKDGLLLLKDEENGLVLPLYEELPEVKAECSDTFTYLFAIDEERFFLARDLEVEGYRYEKMFYLRKAKPKRYTYAGLVGLQLAAWLESRQFCGKCGAKMVHSETEQQMHCPNCGVVEYPKICPCVIVGVIHDGKILVSHYAGGFTNHYALIAGFAEFGESIEACVHREVMEETGLRVKNLKYYKSQPWPFSSSLLFGFFCELEGEANIVLDENELAMAKFISPEEVYEPWNDYALTNEMLCKFRDDYLKYGKLML